MRLHALIFAVSTLFLICSVAAFSVPSSIIAYVPVNLINSQTSGFAQDSQIMISVNSLAYESYEAPNLQNVEFFYSNSTIIPSWLEGNSTNELNANSLYTSTNTVYWLLIAPANTFLKADSSNIVYMGFAPASNNLMSTGTTGEAPQLSCSGNPVNPVNCNGVYAEYDNGANIFPLYLNFQGTSQPSGWTEVATGGSFTFDNGLEESAETGESAALYDAGGSYDPQGNVIDGLFTSATSGSDQLVGWTDSSPTGNSALWWGILGDAVGAGAGGGSPVGFELVYVDGGTGTNVQYSKNPSTPFVASASWQGTGASATWNYSISETTTSAVSESSAYPMLYDNNGQTADYQWFRMRVNPPNGVMASAQFESLVSLVPPPSISIANALEPNAIDVIAGSASDTALVTATCYSGDTCQIDDSAGTALASGTTTATLAYDSLPLGYTTLYANDISAGLTSNNVYVRRISLSSSITFGLTNYQSSAVQANTPLLIDFNALAYNARESNSLDNIAIYFANGTVAYSWLEGNVLDEQTPANELSSSANVVIWFKSPDTDEYLPANTGSATSNSIYLGFASTSNNLLDGNFIGEAPELSPAYAQYDNGANVFTSYLNFEGTTLPSDYQVKKTASYTIDNGLTGTFGLSTYLDIISSNTFSYPLVEDLDVNSVTTTEGMPVLPFVVESTSNAITGYVNTVPVAPDDGYATTIYYDPDVGYDLQIFPTVEDTGSPLITETLDPQSVISMVWGSGFETAYENYSRADTTSGTQTGVGDYYLAVGGGTGSEGQGSFTAYWFRARLYPPNGIMPTVELYAAAAPTITLSNALTPNYMEVIAGSASDNALVTATCATNDTCEIEDSNGVVVSSGTTTATLAYNALPLGYATLYANDISAGLASNSVYVRRISAIRSVKVTLTNLQSYAVAANTPLSIAFNALSYANYESNGLANLALYFQNGTVAYSWIEGDPSNELSDSLSTSSNVIIWFRSPNTDAFLGANTGSPATNIIYIGFSGTFNTLLDGNFIGEAPQLSSPYAEYDTGDSVFNFYINGNAIPQLLSGTASYQNGYDGAASQLSLGNAGGMNAIAITPNSETLEDLYFFVNAPGLTQNEVLTEWTYSPGSIYDHFLGAVSATTFDGYSSMEGDDYNSQLSLYADQARTLLSSAPFVYTYNSWVSSGLMISGSTITAFAYNSMSLSIQSNDVQFSATNSLYSSFNAIFFAPYFSSNTVTSYLGMIVGRTAAPNGIMPSDQFTPAYFYAPSITLANALTPNAIDVVAGSQSDNALVTATCHTGDTCEIEDSAGSVVATGTTTATLAYNSLPIGYSELYANDITDGMASGIASVRRVTVLSSIPYTFVNKGSTPFSANTSLSIDFNALGNRSIESNSLNNTLVYFRNGTVAYSWIEGNQLNQLAPGNLLYGAANVIIWFKSPPSNAFLPADTNGVTTATVYLGFSGTSNSMLDGNFTGEAPYLSSAYAQYDNGANVFELYFNGDTPLSSFTVGSGFTLTQASGVTIGDDVVNALQVEGSCSYPCLSYVYDKGVPNNPTILQAAVANNNHGINLASIDIQNGNTAESSATDVEAVYSGYSAAGFSLAYIQSGSYTADIDSQGSVTTSLDFYTVYYLGSSSSIFNGSISPTLYSGGWSGTVAHNPLASANTLYIGDGIGNNPSTPTNEYIEFARALVPTPPGESSSSYTAPSIAALSPTSQSVTQGQDAIIDDNGISGGETPYSYQWYASANGTPSPTSANAVEANTLLGTGTASGEAQSQNALFATTGSTAAGTYYFALYGTDSEPITVNTSAATVTVQAVATTTVSSGGGSPGPSLISVSDNIDSDSASAAPVFTVGSAQYYQDQLPAQAPFSGSYAYVKFACNVTLGSTTYAYQDDVYGLGVGAACNQTYQTNAGSLEAIYALARNATTSVTTVATTTIAASTANVTTIGQTSTVPETTMPPTTTISSYVSNITVSANSPAQLNVTPFMVLKISSANQSSQQIQVMVENQTPQSTSPANYSKIYVFALNATPQGSVTINTTIEYNCSLNPRVVPFAYINGTWQQIYDAVVLQDPCRIAFSAPNGHEVGIFERSLASTSTNQTATVTSERSSAIPAYAYAIVIILVAALLLFLLYKRRRRRSPRR